MQPPNNVATGIDPAPNVAPALTNRQISQCAQRAREQAGEAPAHHNQVR
jgi:hypothetical protein